MHIVPGSIEHRGRAYTLLRDSGPDVPPYTGSQGPSPHEVLNLGNELERGTGGQLQVLVEERLDGLSISYGMSKDMTICYSFGPARAVHSMCRNEGKVSTCYGTCAFSPGINEIKEMVKSCIKSGDIVCRFTEKESQVGFLFVLGGTMSSLGAAAHAWDPIIQRVECLACCLRLSKCTGHKYATIIMGRHYVAAMRRAKAPLPAPETD